ncbi:MAG: immunity 53 family protein [Bacteroidales bacterium]|nr:immunity 53 family protein [Bacteroidales bacterium]
MENFKWFEKWYSKHVIEHYKEDITVKIENKNNLGWRLFVDFSSANYKHLNGLSESKKVSDYNYFLINAKEKIFSGEGDFTKLDFLIGKFRAYLGETDFHSHENDMFLNPDIQNFIFENEKNELIFLHYTSEKETADKILKEGFRYQTSFDKTTTLIKNDKIDINYNHLIRKPFGKFVVVISIQKKLHSKYNQLVNNAGKKELKVEEVLSEKPVYEDEFNEKTYTLHHKFIKGYINYSSGQIVKNAEFNSGFDSDLFKSFI